MFVKKICEKYKEDKTEDRTLGYKLLFQTLYFWKLSFVGLQRCL